MKGATADPSVNTISADRRIIVRKIGPNHHFFRTFMKTQSSRSIESIDFLGTSVAAYWHGVGSAQGQPSSQSKS